MALAKTFALIRSIIGFGEASTAILPAELPNLAASTPEALAAFAGLSPSEHFTGNSRRGSGTISRICSERLRRTLLMGALRAKRTNNASGRLPRPHDRRR